MSKKTKKQSVLLSFDFHECWKLLKNTGISRVSRESVDALNNFVTRRARELATKAVALAAEKGREEVLEEDITQAVRMASAIATYEVDKEAPVVHYVWFISSGGTCLMSRSYSGLKFPDTIFSGLMTGILDLMNEVTGRIIEKFSTDDLTIHIRRIGEITVAVICDSEQSDPIDELTDLLALRFTDVFVDEIKLDIVDTSIFDDFAPVLDTLVAGAGLKIPMESLKVIKTSAGLTDKQLEETVDAAALRGEMRRAQERISDLFRKDNELETVESDMMRSLFHESPDVSEIKAVLRQATQDIREEYPAEETSVPDVSRDEVMAEIIKDFPEIALKNDIAEKKPVKQAKKPVKQAKKPVEQAKKPKKKSRRKRKRK